MFDELAIFEVKLILRDPADLVQYKKIIKKIRDTNFSHVILDALTEALAEHEILVNIKPTVTQEK